MNQKILELTSNLLKSFFSKGETQAPAVATPEPVAPAPAPVQQAAPVAAPELVIDWNNPEYKISKHFTVKESIYLNSWHVFHHPTNDQKKAILEIAVSIDKVCDILSEKLGKPVGISVHAWMRPSVALCPNTPWDGQDYNKWIYWNQVWVGLTDAEKAAKHVPLSPHRTGHAVDFHVLGFEGPEGCAKIRQMILPHLEELGLRMEDISGGWVHLDNLPVVHQRFFKP